MKHMIFHNLRLLIIEERIQVELITPDKGRVLRGEIGVGISAKLSRKLEHTDSLFEITWAGFGKLSISREFDRDSKVDRYDFRWELEKESGQLKDTFDLDGSHWYGAAQVNSQTWPIEKWSMKLAPYVAGDSYADEWGGVLERYWLNSNGVAIFVQPEVPLFVGMNVKQDRKLTFQSKFASPYKNIDKSKMFLRYSLFLGSNVKHVHLNATGLIFDKPAGIPDQSVLRYPIWSTWAKYKKDVNQGNVLTLAEEIRHYNFKASNFEIDDDWTPKYGDMDFDPKKFPDPSGMMKILKDKNFRVTLWVHPFASPLSKAHYTGMSQNYWVRTAEVLPGETKWWNGIAKILDVTNPAAVQWFEDNLKSLQQKYAITSFKFDAGETNWLPALFKTCEDMSSPNDYTEKYAEMAYEVDSSLRAQEVRVGCRSQRLPILVRMMDKDSNWGWHNGLKTLIPHALTFGLIGYPFVLPDMIGGNAYEKKQPVPPKELFIRWLQACVFMPSLQFSVTPWTYDEETIAISRKLVELHESFSELVIRLANEASQTGWPINRPIWWIAPEDEYALTVDDEYLLGDDLLVAPVLDQGAEARDIYLPAGHWKDELKQQLLEGGRWYMNYEAKLEDLPYFTRLKNIE